MNCFMVIKTAIMIIVSSSLDVIGLDMRPPDKMRANALFARRMNL